MVFNITKQVPMVGKESLETPPGRKVKGQLNFLCLVQFWTLYFFGKLNMRMVWVRPLGHRSVGPF